MTPDIVSQLMDRMKAQPRTRSELHRAAAASGSGWSEDQVGLLLEVLPGVEREGDSFAVSDSNSTDPVILALKDLVGPRPIPATVLVRRLPRGLIVSPAQLCELARVHSDFELVGSNRIKQR